MASYPEIEQSLLLGVFPKSEDKSSLQRTCLAWNNQLFSKTINHNTSQLAEFKNKHAGTHIYFWNPQPILSEVIQNPTQHGYPDHLLFNTNNSKRQDAQSLTQQITYCGNTAIGADNNPDHYLFYNFIHPTPSAYSIMERNLTRAAAELI